MKKMTEENVKSSFSGESQAHIRYLAFAEKALSEKLFNIGRLFKAAALSEKIHATNHLTVLSGIRTTRENIQEAIQGEMFEVSEMYPAYLEVAQAQGEKKAGIYLHAALEAEKVHAELFRKALASLEKGKDLELTEIYICSTCGYSMEGEPPDKCPVCGAPREKFVAF